MMSFGDCNLMMVLGKFDRSRYEEIYGGWHRYDDAPEEYHRIEDKIGCCERDAEEDAEYHITQLTNITESGTKRYTGWSVVGFNERTGDVFAKMILFRKNASAKTLQTLFDQFANYVERCLVVFRQHGLI